MWVLGIEPRALYIQGKNFATQAIIPDTSLKMKRKLRGLEEERRGDSICHQFHVSIVLLYLTPISLKSEASLSQKSSATVPTAESMICNVHWVFSFDYSSESHW